MINVDGLFNDGDEDFQHEFKIEDLNNILVNNGLINKFNDIINNAVEAAGKIDLKEMEIVIASGTTRIPLLQKVLTNYLLTHQAKIQTLNLTLNMDECVSTGCSYYDAILHNKISYNINDKYSGIIIDSSNIKQKKDITRLLSKIKNFMYYYYYYYLVSSNLIKLFQKRLKVRLFFIILTVINITFNSIFYYIKMIIIVRKVLNIFMRN